MIVDRLFAAAELRYGSGDRQKRVRIVRTDGRPASRARRIPGKRKGRTRRLGR
jgi:type IV secretory pathway VirB9-like protein